jgi:hypothetical protein
MPLAGERKRAWQRQYMRDLRAANDKRLVPVLQGPPQLFWGRQGAHPPGLGCQVERRVSGRETHETHIR